LTDDARDQELRHFFRERIVPAAGRLRDRGVTFFPLEPDRSAESYWSVRRRGEPYIFQIGDDLGAELRDIWRESPELQSLADDLAAMSRRMADEGQDRADVSSFIYAMF
jgi:hypothetical protein